MCQERVEFAGTVTARGMTLLRLSLRRAIKSDLWVTKTICSRVTVSTDYLAAKNPTQILILKSSSQEDLHGKK